MPNSSSSGTIDLDSDISVDCDELTSAQTLFQAGRGCYDRGDVQSARLYFGLAEKLFVRADEPSNAYIARDWFESLAKRA